ncbi:MAG: hypothetical protein ABI554_09190 [Flavobacterium sp.]
MGSYKNQNTQLDEAIARLELERDLQLDQLQEQLQVTFHSMKPITILNDTLEDFKRFPEVKSNLIQLVTSLVGGYISKKVLIGKSNSKVKKLLGYLLQYGVTNFISKKVNCNE